MRLDMEQTMTIVAVQQLIYSWARELDFNEGLGMSELIAQSCKYRVRGSVREGPEAVSSFYRERLEQLEQAGGAPTQRHVVSNVIVAPDGPDRAEVTFSLVYFASSQKPPVTDFKGPIAVADCMMTCVREGDGHWRISMFDSSQSFQRQMD